MYNKKQKIILFDIGGTLFKDGKSNFANGFSALVDVAENPEVTTAVELEKYWDAYIQEVCIGLKSKSGIALDIPLSAILKYSTMNAGLRINLSMAEQEELFDRYNSTREVMDGIPQLFEALEKLNIRYAVISNNAMSGDSLALAVKYWIPTAKPEFCLTSADLLFTKPSSCIFHAAANYAHLKPAECWYCGDTKIPDVDGAQGAGMVPVFIDVKSAMSSEFRQDGIAGEYLTVNNWNVLTEYLNNI